MNGEAGTIFMVAYLALEAMMKYEVEQLNKIRVPKMLQVLSIRLGSRWSSDLYSLVNRRLYSCIPY